MRPMLSIRSLLLWCFALQLASAVTLERRSTISCTSHDSHIESFNAQVRAPGTFCKWWLKSSKSHAPFTTLSITDTTEVCGCIQAHSYLAKSTMKKETIPRVALSFDYLKHEFKSPTGFCRFWNKQSHRSSSPLDGSIKPSKLYPFCSSVIKMAETTTTKKSTTKKSTTKKSTTKTSTTKKSTTKKSTTKKTSSSSKTPVAYTTSATSESSLTSTITSSSPPAYNTTPVTSDDSLTISTTPVTSQVGPAPYVTTSTRTTSSSTAAENTPAPYLPHTTSSKASSSLADVSSSSSTIAVSAVYSTSSTSSISSSSASSEVPSPLSSSTIIETTSTRSSATSGSTTSLSPFTSSSSSSEQSTLPVSSISSSSDSSSLTSSSESSSTTGLISSSSSTTSEITTSSLSSSSASSSSSSSSSSTGLSPAVTNVMNYLQDNQQTTDGSTVGRRNNRRANSRMLLIQVPTQGQDTLAFQADDNSITGQAALDTDIINDGLSSSQSIVSMLDAAMITGTCPINSTDPSVNGTIANYVQNTGIMTGMASNTTFTDGFLSAGCQNLMVAFTGAQETQGLCAAATDDDVKTAFTCYVTNCNGKTVVGTSGQTRRQAGSSLTGSDDSSPAVPTFMVSFQTTFDANFSIVPDEIVSDLQSTGGVIVDNGVTLVCDDCSLQITALQVSGAVAVNFATNEISVSQLQITDTSSAHVKVGLKAAQAIDSAKNWTFSTASIQLQQASKNNILDISPMILFSPGASVYSTGPISSAKAGAEMSWTNASVQLDPIKSMLIRTSQMTPEIDNYEPTLAYDSTQTSQTLQMATFMRRSYQFSMSLFGQNITNTVALTSQAGVNNQAQYHDVYSTCSARTMSMTTYSGAEHELVFGNGSSSLLYQHTNNVINPVCRYLPAIMPSFDQISTLRADYSSWCVASVLSTNAPTTGAVLTDTTVEVVGFSTTTLPSIVQSVPTVTTTVVTTVTATRSVGSTVTVNGVLAGAQTIPEIFYRRDAVPTAMAAPFAFVGNSSVYSHAKRDVPAGGPSFVTGWADDELFYACTQAATGGHIVTLTTSTFSSTTSISTVTVYSQSQQDSGNVVTSTATSTSVVFVSSDISVATRTVDTSCAIQTEKSCFRIKAKSAVSRVDGRYLGMNDATAAVSFNNQTASVFYLTCQGHVISLPDFRFLAYQSSLLAVALGGGLEAYEAAICNQDLASNDLTCQDLNGNSVLYIYDPSSPYWTQPAAGVSFKEDPSYWVPRFTYGDISGEYADYAPQDYSTLSLVTEPAECPCISPITQDLVDDSADQYVCPAADGQVLTDYRTLDQHNPSTDPSFTYVSYQMQCGLVYPVDYRALMDYGDSITTAYECANICSVSERCVAAQWIPSQKRCYALASAIGAPGLSTDTIGYDAANMVLAKIASPPSYSQFLLNDTFPVVQQADGSYTAPPWTVSKPITPSTNGSFAFSVEVGGTGGSTRIYQDLDALIPGQYYVWTVSARCSTNDMAVTLDLGTGDLSGPMTLGAVPDPIFNEDGGVFMAPFADITVAEVTFGPVYASGDGSGTTGSALSSSAVDLRLASFDIYGPFPDSDSAQTFSNSIL